MHIKGGVSKEDLRNKWWKAVGLMIGAVVGVGIYGIPYVFSQSGYIIGVLELVLVGFLVLILNLLYAEITIQTPGHRRFNGFVKMYLGKFPAFLATLAFFGSLLGGMTAFLIIGGKFLSIILGGFLMGGDFFYVAVFALIGSFLITFNLRKTSVWQGIAVVIFLTFFLILFLYGLPHIQISNLAQINVENIFSPYGVLLFSFGGLGIIPEAHDVLGEKHERRLPSAIIFAMMIVMALYGLFALVVLGVSGVGTTTDAITGFSNAISSDFIVFGSLLVLFTIFSIYLNFGTQIKDTLMIDFKLNKTSAWFATAFAPFVLYLLGAREFIDLIEFIGVVFGATTAIFVVLSYDRMRARFCGAHKCFIVPRPAYFALMLVFIFGAIVTLVK